MTSEIHLVAEKFAKSKGITREELDRLLRSADGTPLRDEWTRFYQANGNLWCFNCKTWHKPTEEHPTCRLCTTAIHEPAPADIHFDYRGWKFTPPFICMGCGIEVCFRQWAFSRSCGGCDVSYSRTRRLIGGKCFAGPHERLSTWNAEESAIPEDHFIDPSQREKYPVIRRRPEFPRPPKPPFRRMRELKQQKPTA